MTVGVAAVACFGSTRNPNVVTVALDRMLTSRDKIEYEQLDKTKLYWLNEAHTIAAINSGVLDSLQLVCQATWREVVRDSLDSVPEIVEVFARHFKELRAKQIEAREFHKFGLTIADFVPKQEQYPTSFREKLLRTIDAPEAVLGDVIIAGIQPSGVARLFSVHDPGEVFAWEASGFVAVGSGDELAESEFIAQLYTPSRNWLEALAITFFAKKTAESAVGVGTHTDLFYISEKGFMYFGPTSPTMLMLEKMYRAKLRARDATVRRFAGGFYSRLAVMQGKPDVTPEPGEEL